MWNVQVLADFPRGELEDFAMARQGGYFPGDAIDVNSMVASLAQKLAAMTLVRSPRWFNGRYVLNTDRVLPIRARQGMIIWLPEGDNSDATRPPSWFDSTTEYLIRRSIPSIGSENWAALESSKKLTKPAG
jgi:hypothetical protein